MKVIDMKIALVSLFSSFLLCGVIHAETFLVTPESLENGPKAPEVISDGLDVAFRFNADADDATAARIRDKKFDFSKGVKIELEFQNDADQSNPFPRLLESGPLSLHFAYDPNAKQSAQALKALLLGEPKEKIIQILGPVAHRPNEWHKLAFTFASDTQVATLTIDGESRSERVPFEFVPKDLLVVLGAAKLERSNRGFSGLIRQVRITTPYSGAEDKNAVSATEEKINLPVEHLTVSALKGRHLAFPGATRLPDGRLAAVFREAEEHICPYGRICITYSADNGKNWSAPVSISDTVSDERDPSIHTLPDGRVLVTHGAWNSWMSMDSLAKKYASETAYIQSQGPEKFSGAWYLFSEDGGNTFSPPIRVPAFSPHGPAVKNGYFYQPTLASENGKRQVYMYRGSPDGKTWEKLGLIGESQNGNVAVTEVFEEPHTAVLSDGTMVTAIRVPSDGYMRVSFSTDDGATWTEPVKTQVRGFPQHLLPLKDGRLLATYGYRYYPMGIRACISRDGGKTWDIDKELVLQNNGDNGDLGYPISFELEGGKVMSVYYSNNARNKECFIEAAIFRP